MPEWVYNVALTVAIQGGIAMMTLGKLRSVVDNLREDVKDMQRDKLDVRVHDATLERLDNDITYVRHGVNGVSQRVTIIEQTRR